MYLRYRVMTVLSLVLMYILKTKIILKKEKRSKCPELLVPPMHTDTWLSKGVPTFPQDILLPLTSLTPSPGQHPQNIPAQSHKLYPYDNVNYCLMLSCDIIRQLYFISMVVIIPLFNALEL